MVLLSKTRMLVAITSIFFIYLFTTILISRSAHLTSNVQPFMQVEVQESAPSISEQDPPSIALSYIPEFYDLYQSQLSLTTYPKIPYEKHKFYSISFSPAPIEEPPKVNCERLTGFILKSNNTFEVSCFDPKIETIGDSFLYKEELGNQLEFMPDDSEDGDVLIKDSEFYFVKCGYSGNDAVLRNVKNRSEEAEMMDLQSELKAAYRISEIRPLSVVVITVDNASRERVYRDLAKTIEIFNQDIQGYSSRYMFYDFLLNSASNRDAVSNFISLFYGMSSERFRAHFSESNIEKDSEKYLFYQTVRSLFAHFKEMGFVTMASFDDYKEDFLKIFGSEVLVDHLVSNFWKISRVFFGQNNTCIGSNPSYYFSLGYLSQFLRNYNKMNKFACVHLNADRNSGLKLSDDYFYDFFNSFFQEFDHKNEDVVFLLIGLEGTSSSEYIEDQYSQLFTNSILISNKELINRLQADLNLKTNIQRMTSFYDWYKTLKYLAYVPYKQINKYSIEFSKIKTDYLSSNLFKESIESSKTCSDIGIPKSRCFFKELVDVDTDDPDSIFIYDFAESAVSAINKVLEQKERCGKVSFGRLIRAQKLTLNEPSPDSLHHYFIQIALSDMKTKLLLYCTRGPESKSDGRGMSKFYSSASLEIHEIREEHISYISNSLKSITRLEPVSGMSFDIFKKQCEHYLKFDHGLYFSNVGINCIQRCSAANMECTKPVAFEIVIETLRSIYHKIAFDGELDSIEIEKGEIKIGRGNFCSNIPEATGICHCSLADSDLWSEAVYLD